MSKDYNLEIVRCCEKGMCMTLYGAISSAPMTETYNTPGFNLLCLLARGAEADGDDVRSRLSQAPLRREFAEAALEQRVAAPVLACLSAHAPHAVSAEILALLRRGAAPFEALAQAAEVLRLAKAFEEACLPMLVLKGVVLSQQLYGDVARRPAGDIDLLVDPDSLAQADALLAALGYLPVNGVLSKRRLAAFVKGAKDLVYKRPETGGLVELHHRLTSNPRLLPADFEALWADRAEVRLAGRAVSALPSGILSLYLCVHGAGHCWERLRWLMDLRDLLVAPGELSDALVQAEARGLLPAMQQAVLLAHRWLGLSVEPAILAAAEKSPKVARLNRFLACSLSGRAWHDGPSRWSRILWMRLHRYTLRSDWRYLAAEFSIDWNNRAPSEVLALPDWLLWAYPFLRPFGWVTRSLFNAKDLGRDESARRS